MTVVPFLLRSAASVGFAYALFILWMAAGLLPVAALALLIHAGLSLARHGDRPLEDWPLLRRLPNPR